VKILFSKKIILASVFSLLAAIFLNIAITGKAWAVTPPEFIFAVTSNIGIVFVFASAFLASVLASIHTHLKVYLKTKKGKLIALLIFLVLAASLTGGIYYYQYWKWQKSYAQWLKKDRQETKAKIANEYKTPSLGSGFFAVNQNLPRIITNSQFQEIIKTQNPYVIDIRSDSEYSSGHFPGSHNLVLKNLLAGDWKNLPTNQVIYIFGDASSDSKKATDFLHSQGIVARYLESGAKSWIDYGGQWNG
jgi:rhodanese-related sulfurtransferase